MQKLPELEVMQRAVRARICPQCYQRPAGSETLGPDVPRTCEPDCTIFHNLPKLRQIALTIHNPSVSPYEGAVRELICQTCHDSPTPGDYCPERTTRDCPLSRYLGEVVDTLERLPKR